MERRWSEKVINEQVFERIREKSTLLNNNLHRKAIWIGYILRRNSLLHYVLDEGSETIRKKKNTAP